MGERWLASQIRKVEEQQAQDEHGGGAGGGRTMRKLRGGRRQEEEVEDPPPSPKPQATIIINNLNIGIMHICMINEIQIIHNNIITHHTRIIIIA